MEATEPVSERLAGIVHPAFECNVILKKKHQKQEDAVKRWGEERKGERRVDIPVVVGIVDSLDDINLSTVRPVGSDGPDGRPGYPKKHERKIKRVKRKP